MKALLLLFTVAAALGSGHVAGVEPPDQVARWRSAVALWFPPEAIDDAMAIIECESGGDPNRTGDLHLPHLTDGIGSHGLFQINGGNIYGRNVVRGLEPWRTYSRQKARAVLRNPVANVRIAAMLYRIERDWSHWYNCARRLGLPTS